MAHRLLPYRERELHRFVSRVEDSIRSDPSIRVTEDPDQACLLIPRIACLSVGQCDLWEGFGEARLRSLPHWDGGRNHVLIDYADDAFSKISGGTGSHEIRLRSGFSPLFLRPGFDVALPLRPRQSLLRDLHRYSQQDGAREMRASERPVLLSFRGTETTADGLRARLAAALSLVGRADVVMEVAASPAARDTSRFRELLLSSKFGLVPRGKGLHSHRLLETLSAGTIPVVVGDDIVLPFGDIVDWHQSSVRVPEARAESALLPWLDELAARPEELDRMQCAVINVYRRVFLQPYGSIALAFRVLLERIRSEAPAALDADTPSGESGRGGSAVARMVLDSPGARLGLRTTPLVERVLLPWELGRAPPAVSFCSSYE